MWIWKQGCQRRCGPSWHQIKLRGDFASSVGGGQAVLRDFATGVNYGASDPRKDGAAMPQPVRTK